LINISNELTHRLDIFEDFLCHSKNTDITSSLSNRDREPLCCHQITFCCWWGSSLV